MKLISPLSAAEKIGLSQNKNAVKVIANFMRQQLPSWAYYPQHVCKREKKLILNPEKSMEKIREWETLYGKEHDAASIWTDPLGDEMKKNLSLIFEDRFFPEAYFIDVIDEVKKSTWAVISPGRMGDLYQFKNWLHNRVESPHNIIVQWGENGSVTIIK